jgi:hypothetical protein
MNVTMWGERTHKYEETMRSIQSGFKYFVSGRVAFLEYSVRHLTPHLGPLLVSPIDRQFKHEIDSTNLLDLRDWKGLLDYGIS